MIWRILLGLLMAFIGFVFVWKTEWFQQNVGSISWAEEKFGSMGGSRLLYKAIGILIFIIGCLVVTNMYKAAFLGVFGWLFPSVKPAPEDEYVGLLYLLTMIG